jgi:phosphoadenosine phosphosulfate reductase
MAQHNIPRHPLADSYVTMGDWHSTAPAEQGVEAESTRYGGQKYECGLHEQSNQSDFQI